MVEQLFAARTVAGGEIRSIAQKIKARAAVAEDRAGDDQCLLAHMRARAGNTVGQETERIGVAEFGSGEAPHDIMAAGEAGVERRPRRADLGFMPMQGLFHVRPQAIDMNVQLVLAAREARIHRESDVVAPERGAGRSDDEAARLPGILPVIGRIRGEQFRALDAFDPAGRDHQILRRPDEILEDGKTSVRPAGEVDLDTGGRIVRLDLFDDALAVDDLPEHVGIDGREMRLGRTRHGERTGKQGTDRIEHGPSLCNRGRRSRAETMPCRAPPGQTPINPACSAPPPRQTHLSAARTHATFAPGGECASREQPMAYPNSHPVGQAIRPAAALAASLLLAFSAAPGRAEDGPVAVDAELVFAVDISYSMNSEEQHLQRAGYVAALKSPEFLHALQSGPLGKIAVAYIQWASSTDQNVVLNWSLIDGAESAQAIADKLGEAGFRRAQRTSISGGIDFAAHMFENNGYDGARRIIDVSGDGPNNNGRPVLEARDEALGKGIVINGLPLVGIRPYIGPADIQDLDIYYQDCVVGGPGSFMIPVHDTNSFVDATRNKLVREIAALPPPARPVQLVADDEPRISCMIGENLWRDRFGN